ncbi:MAG: hypothetical protein H0U50_04530, partial [Pyrinomonadaceae bacterium]|nr:hypothetical protein [Pyrinomonadaceae bacterium]
MIKKFFPFVLVLCVGLILSVTPISASKAASGDKVWREIDNTPSSQTESLMTSDDYKTFRLDKTLLRSILEQAPLEFGKSPLESAATATEAVILTLPLPDGTFSRFSIKESPIMEAGLAAKFPGITTYIGEGVDNPGAVTRFSLSPTGFRAMILSAAGTIIIDPSAKDNTENYISFDKANASRNDPFICKFNNEFANLAKTDFENISELNFPSVSNGTMLRTYRLALAATGEYTNVFRFVGDTDAQAKARALEQQIIIMNRVNGIFERDLAVRMILVANNDSIIYTNSATDPYTNNNGDAMLAQNQTTLDETIGTTNYDIGHVFSTGGGGIASLRVPCSPTSKARGVTGRSNPIGDAFSVDYVAHEMGHQFGANHTFNGTVSGCGGNRSGSNAYEPGSGVTVMSYAGICGNQNTARNSIDTFHVRSLEEIITFISNSITGGSCPVNIQTANSVPTVALVGAAFFNVPKQTPFTLSAVGSDLNNDSITYDWQQYDLGGSTTAVPNTDSDGTARPIFRSYVPRTDGMRTFPSLQYILDNANAPPATTITNGIVLLTGELLPAISRTMNFQVVARDNRAGGGGVNTATVQVAVEGNSGPFVLTAPNSSVTLNGGSSQTVTWDVANTTAAPINAANVRILLSTDGGQTFPTVLANSTANDGSETITLPITTTTTARIKIEAVGNIFFDISNVNFTINTTEPRKSPFDFDGDGKTDLSIFRPAVGEWWYLRSSDGGNGAVQFGSSTDKIVPADFTGDGKT